MFKLAKKLNKKDLIFFILSIIPLERRWTMLNQVVLVGRLAHEIQINKRKSIYHLCLTRNQGWFVSFLFLSAHTKLFLRFLTSVITPLSTMTDMFEVLKLKGSGVAALASASEAKTAVRPKIFNIFSERILKSFPCLY